MLESQPVSCYSLEKSREEWVPSAEKFGEYAKVVYAAYGHGLFGVLAQSLSSWHPEPIQNGTCFLSILEWKGGLGWTTANAFKVLPQAKVNRVTVCGWAYSFSNGFHMFPESPLLYKRMADILEMGGWVLCTTVSGDHWQGRGGKQWVLLWRTTRRKPTIPKGNSLKTSPRRKGMAGKPCNCSIPGIFLWSHSLILRLQTLLLQLPSTLSSASSHLISSRSQLLFCDS